MREEDICRKRYSASSITFLAKNRAALSMLRHAGVHLQDGTVLRADLVVDASGPRGKTQTWLAEGGYSMQNLRIVEVDPHVGYTMEFIDVPDEARSSSASPVLTLGSNPGTSQNPEYHPRHTLVQLRGCWLFCVELYMGERPHAQSWPPPADCQGDPVEAQLRATGSA